MLLGFLSFLTVKKSSVFKSSIYLKTLCEDEEAKDEDDDSDVKEEEEEEEENPVLVVWSGDE